MPLTLKMIKGLNLLPLGGPVPSGAYIARPLLSAWFYDEPLGGNLSAEYLRFDPGYFQIPYLQIHAAFCRYHLNCYISVIS